MRFLVALLALCAPASALDVEAVNEAPVTIAIGETGEAGGYTFAEVALTNETGAQIEEASVHCRMRNAGGYTWPATGRFGVIEPGDTRSLRVVSDYESDEYSRDPTEIRCVLRSFDAPMRSAEF